MVMVMTCWTWLDKAEGIMGLDYLSDEASAGPLLCIFMRKNHWNGKYSQLECLLFQQINNQTNIKGKKAFSKGTQSSWLNIHTLKVLARVWLIEFQPSPCLQAKSCNNCWALLILLCLHSCVCFVALLFCLHRSTAQWDGRSVQHSTGLDLLVKNMTELQKDESHNFTNISNRLIVYTVKFQNRRHVGPLCHQIWQIYHILVFVYI